MTENAKQSELERGVDIGYLAHVLEHGFANDIEGFYEEYDPIYHFTEEERKFFEGRDK